MKGFKLRIFACFTRAEQLLLIMTVTADFDALKIEFSERSKPIVFWTGAGVSTPLPGWTTLRDQLIDEGRRISNSLKPADQQAYAAELAQIKATSDIWLQFERLEKRLGTDPYSRVIKQSLAPSERAMVPSVQQRIWELAPSGVVTLNLDLFTQRSSTAHPTKAVPISISPLGFGDALNVLKEKRPFIAYPHGHLDTPGQWTFTKAELDARLGDPHYIEWLTILFRAATVVFVGITASDVAIGSPIERITSAGRVPLTGHYWISARDDLSAQEWASGHGVRMVRYENRSGRHDEVLHLLNALAVPVRLEDPKKEVPIVPKEVLTLKGTFPSPEELAREDEETIRRALNAKAVSILSNADEQLRNSEYQAFINNYARAIHRAWYASTSTGENHFLGYHLAEEVAGGAFGTVFKGYSEEGDEIAVKILKNENFRKQDFHRSFRRGANSLRILTERGIPGVIGYIDAAEIPPSIVMEWSDGHNLTSLVESGRLNNWPERIVTALELARIIRTCHGLPERVLHRDLRPANVMIEHAYDEFAEWKVKVLDFDLSWHKGAEDHSIMHSPAFGYLAPEQRVKSAYTTRNALVDSYGFGMTLYFICTGRNPFPDQHMGPNWIRELQQFEMKRCPEWESLPRRVARLVHSATLHEQPGRATMSQIEGELDSLRLASMTQERVPLVDVITEELAFRTAHFHGYKWIESDSVASLSSANGVNLKLETIPGTRVIKFSTAWSNSGAQDWNHIDRMINQAVPRLEEALKDVSSSVKIDRRRHAFDASAQLSADEVRADPRRFAKALDKAVEHASAIANF
jgi:eukaryotic-like serine/threonine-protein kinase